VWWAGLRKGDVVVTVNRQTISDLNGMQLALKDSEKGILLNVRRGNSALFILIQ
jgi:S1-C subfamily serine protease